MLKSGQICRLIEQDALQSGLFDERNMFEFAHPDYPGERLVACRNPALAALLDATEIELGEVRARVEGGRLAGAVKIGVRVGRVLDKDKMAKHFVLDIEEDRFSWRHDGLAIEREVALDGLYVIRAAVMAQTREALHSCATTRGCPRSNGCFDHSRQGV